VRTRTADLYGVNLNSLHDATGTVEARGNMCKTTFQRYGERCGIPRALFLVPRGTVDLRVFPRSTAPILTKLAFTSLYTRVWFASSTEGTRNEETQTIQEGDEEFEADQVRGETCGKY
jgi:hypothetical protein